MISFADRSEKAQTLIALIYRHFWDVEPCRSILTPVRYGYEEITTPEARSRLRYCRTVTAKHIRFAPDSLILNCRDDAQHHLLDYKVTQTPIFSPRRVALIRAEADDPTLTSDSIGQVEADALENYLRLAQVGVRTAILNHCAYHATPLLCEFADRIQILHRDKVTSSTRTGSGTPFANIDCRSMRSFADFLLEEHRMAIDSAAYETAVTAILHALPITEVS